jgi:hypothetical protein
VKQWDFGCDPALDMPPRPASLSKPFAFWKGRNEEDAVLRDKNPTTGRRKLSQFFSVQGKLGVLRGQPCDLS